LWQGLGYQRRAKALYNIAKTAKTVPRNIEGLRELPSIGEYTAGAILAFAYDQKSVLLETNIRTALIEAFHKKKESVSDEILKKDLEKLLNTKVVKRIGYRTWYYALMDYGAYLKTQGTSHNVKAAGYRKQTPFKGSSRELRAKILFAITEKKSLPHDARAQTVINALLKEGFIKKSGISWKIA
jgi:A/G-specific adenine glycosylase